jgi:hypothetical protein
MRKIALVVIALAAVMTSCLDAQTSSQNPKDLTGFESIALGTSVDVIVTPGDYEVRVEGPDAERVQLSVSDDGTLGISKKGNGWNWSRGSAKVYVSMPTISAIAIGGSGDVTITEPFDKLGDLSISIGGSGDVVFKGNNAKTVTIAVAGSGNVDAAELTGASCEVSIAGSGDVKIGEMNRLEVSIAGSGDVRYKGDPSIEKSVLGSGDVKRM